MYNTYKRLRKEAAGQGLTLREYLAARPLLSLPLLYRENILARRRPLQGQPVKADRIAPNIRSIAAERG